MQAEDLTVHQGGQRKVVKQVGEILPHIGIAVLAQTFIIKPVNLEKNVMEKPVSIIP